MRQTISFSVGIVLYSTAAFAVETVSLSDVLTTATGLAIIAPGFIAVASPDGGFVCQIGVNDSYFKQIANGLEPFPEMAPQSICVSAKHAISLGKE